MSSDLKFLHAFNSIPGIGPASLRALKKHFAAYEEAWRAGESAFVEACLDPRAIQAILWKRPSLHPDKELEKLIRENMWVITEEDPAYPERLREIHASPVILYGRGEPKILARNLSIAIVGTRRPTNYGLEVAEALSYALTQAGFSIISGLATGIDARAHEAAIETKGLTVAVLGSGLDPNSIFPPENRGLARRIVDTGGAIIGEYSPGTPALKDHFPQRNRIISGLALGVVVVEAREKSGALITARFALEQNREVFAVPGSIFSPTSAGPMLLIQQGAKLVRTAEDILEELGIEYTTKESEERDSMASEEEKTLLEILESPLGIDALKEKTGYAVPVIMASLSMLELKNRVRNLGGNVYQRI